MFFQSVAQSYYLQEIKLHLEGISQYREELLPETILFERHSENRWIYQDLAIVMF